jgi:hypothetical protein
MLADVKIGSTIAKKNIPILRMIAIFTTAISQTDRPICPFLVGRRPKPFTKPDIADVSGRN